MVQEIPSSPVVIVDQAPEDDAGPSSLPIEDLADSLVPIQVAELVGASQAGMSFSSPLLHQSVCFPFSDNTELGPSRQLLNDLSVLNLSLSSLDSVILFVPELSGPPPSLVFDATLIPCSRPSVSEPLPYNLRPRANRGGSGLTVGGLASNPVVIGARKLRG